MTDKSQPACALDLLLAQMPLIKVEGVSAMADSIDLDALPNIAINLPPDLLKLLDEWQPMFTLEFKNDRPAELTREEKILHILRFHLEPEPDIGDDVIPF